jgi:membrane protein
MAQRRRLKTKNRWRRVISPLVSIGLLFKKAASEWRRDNVLRLAAAVSFFAVLSLAPLLAIVIRLMGMVHATQFGRDQLIKQTTYLMGKDAADAIKPIIQRNAALHTGVLATAISTVVLLFSATGVFIELRESMNTIWGREFRAFKKKFKDQAVLGFIRARLLSLAMVFGLGFLLVLSMFISGVLTAFQQQIARVDRWPAYLAAGAISYTVQFALFLAIFKFLPDVPLRWKNVWHGALVAAVLFGAGRFGLAIYFKYSSNNNLYGAAASLVAVLTWIYYSCFSLFYGAEFTKVWTRKYDRSCEST